METGDNISNSDNSSSPDLKNTHVIIHLRYDGLSLLIADSSRKHIMELLSTNWLAGKDNKHLIKEAGKFFEENELDLSQASSIQWLLSFSRFCLIPDILYEQGGGKTILANTSRLSNDDQIYSDFWSRRDIVEMYALSTELHGYLQQQNSNTTIAHNGYAINALSNAFPNEGNFCFLQVSNSFAELLIVQKDKVIFYNQFAHDVPEDLLYYILFALEQNRILAPEITLFTSGDVQKGEGMQALLSKYIGKVEDVKLPKKAEAARHLTNNQLRRAVNLIAVL